MASPSGSKNARRALGLRDKAAAPQLETESSEERESAEQRTGTSEKESTRSESRGERSGETPGKPRESKKQLPSSERNPESSFDSQGSLNQATQRNLGVAPQQQECPPGIPAVLSQYRFRQQRCPQQGTSFQRAKIIPERNIIPETNRKAIVI
jgi:hypothetical protein